jgi:putative dimethyl sulfoxide reductase chaperone
LEYLYFLVDREGQALSNKDLGVAREMASRQQSFLESWLLPWLEPFSDRLLTTDAQLYQWGASVLLAFAREELVWLKKLR